MIVNAAEAITLAADGRREIGIETSRPAVGCIAIAIRDSGVGTRDLQLERMFDHFVSTKPGPLTLCGRPRPAALRSRTST